MTESRDDDARAGSTSYQFFGGAKDCEWVPLTNGELLPAAIQPDGWNGVGTGYHALDRERRLYVWALSKHQRTTLDADERLIQ